MSGWLHLARFARDPLLYIDRTFRRYGPIASMVFRRGTHVCSTYPVSAGTVFVHGEELNRSVVTQHDVFHKTGLSGPLYPSKGASPRTRPLLRMLTGLFHANGAEHKAQRRLLLPAFHKKRVEGYRDDMVAITASALEGFAAGQRRDLRQDTMELTLRIVTRTLLGTDLGEEGVRVGRELQRWLTLLSGASALPLDLPPLPYARWLGVTASLDARMRAIIESKRRAPSGDDMLSTLLEVTDESGAHLDDDELIGHTSVIFAAGHETSSNALCWTLFLLSQHPRVMADLFDELQGELRGDAPTVEQLGRLPLLDRVVKESLRLCPPAPLNHRVAARETELGGHRIPYGTELLVSIYHTQRDPEIYREPDRFLPERWESLQPGPYSYNPFSAGPRMCIGAAFAIMEIKIVLCMLLARFRFELAEGARVDRLVSITMAPKRGLFMNLHGPDGRFEQSSRQVRGNVRSMDELEA